MNENQSQPLINRAAAASLLGISERTLWSLTKNGTVPVIRIGRSVRYSVAALELWIAGQTEGGNVESNSPPKKEPIPFDHSCKFNKRNESGNGWGHDA